MAYDRDDPRSGPRDDRSRWSGGRRDEHGRGQGGGFFERAGEEISSWFGGSDDDHPEQRSREHERGRGSPGWEQGRSQSRDQPQRYGAPQGYGPQQGRPEREYRPSQPTGMSGFDQDRSSGRPEMWGGGDDGYERERSRGPSQERGGYRPITGDYGRGSRYESGGYDHDDRQQSQSKWDQDAYRRTSFAGSADSSQHRSQNPSQSAQQQQHDPHYQEWRQRQMAELDRDYDEYRREHQSKFENDFGSWRNQRQTKRQMVGQAREHMEVVGSDEQHVGTVDKIAGDRIILTKSDPDAGGVHHSISCNELDRIEGQRIILNCTAEQAKTRWRDEDRSRALFEREDSGSEGPHMLDRSFSGTYRKD
jgi:hypothetical protein